MFKKNECKLMILSILLVIPLMLGFASNTLANGVEPPPEGSEFVEDAEMMGDLTLIWGTGPVTSGFQPGFWAAFVGTCYNLDDEGKRQNFPIYIPPTHFVGDDERFVEATEDDIMVEFSADGLEECLGDLATSAAVTAVKKFSNSGLEINAKVTIWGLVAPPE
jgi:hypothetical protein